MSIENDVKELIKGQLMESELIRLKKKLRPIIRKELEAHLEELRKAIREIKI